MKRFEICFSHQPTVQLSQRAQLGHMFPEYLLPNYIFMKEHRGRGIFMCFPYVCIKELYSHYISEGLSN